MEGTWVMFGPTEFQPPQVTLQRAILYRWRSLALDGPVIFKSHSHTQG